MKFLRMWAVPAHALSSHGRAAVKRHRANFALLLHSKKPARHLGPGGRRIRAVRSLSKDFTGVGYNQKGVGINLFQVAAQKHGLSPGEDGEHHVVLRVGIGAWACHTVAPRPRVWVI